MIINSYYKEQILKGPNKNDPLFLKTIELEKELDETLKKIGFDKNDYQLYLTPTLMPNDGSFNAIFDLTFPKDNNFGYTMDYKEDVISLPNKKAIETIIKDCIQGAKEILDDIQSELKIAYKYPERMNKNKKLEKTIIKAIDNFQKFKE